jgi:hypothetical protein
VSSRKLHNRSPHSEEENRSDAHDEHCQEREITSSSTQNFEIATLDQDRTSYASLSHKVKGSLIKVGPNSVVWNRLDESPSRIDGRSPANHRKSNALSSR